MDDINRLSELSIAAKQKTKERDYRLDRLSGDLTKSVFPYDYNRNAGKGPVVETIKFKKVEYNSLRYQKHSAGRIIEHLKRLMEIAFFNVDIPLTGIQILTEEEKNRLLIEFNDTKTQFPAGKTVVELFEERFDKYPERIAVPGKRTTLPWKSGTWDPIN